MTPSKIRRAAVLAATSFSAVALLTAGGLSAADDAAAQEATQSYVGQMRYDGDLPFDSRAIILQVVCDAATSGTSPGSCHAEGTFTITVTAAAKQKLGLSSATVGRGVLKNYGAVSLSGGRELTIPAAVKPKLKAFYDKAQKKCGDCGHASPVAGRVSVSLTGPQGLPDETLRDSVVLWIGSRYARGDKTGWAWDCTSNWYGPCTPGASGQPPRPEAAPIG
jgi:hypothetical protein